MALTDKQIDYIQKLDAQTALDTMHECAERLGLVSVDEYCVIMGVKRRTVYKAAKDNKLIKFEISGHIFLAVNDNNS
jgi:hypothetical protein